MQPGKARLLSAAVAAVMAVAALGVTPAMAQEDECQGGSPDYWLESPWPDPFKVPKAFRMPNGKVATVQPWTKFDNVFRYRNGRDAEGRVFPGKTLKQVLKLKGNSKQGLARQTIAALLNTAEPNNDFDWPTEFGIIRDFQIYWDGTDDMSEKKGRNYLQKRYQEWNDAACPIEPAA